MIKIKKSNKNFKAVYCMGKLNKMIASSETRAWVLYARAKNNTLTYTDSKMLIQTDINIDDGYYTFFKCNKTFVDLYKIVGLDQDQYYPDIKPVLDVKERNTTDFKFDTDCFPENYLYQLYDLFKGCFQVKYINLVCMLYDSPNGVSLNYTDDHSPIVVLHDKANMALMPFSNLKKWSV